MGLLSDVEVGCGKAGKELLESSPTEWLNKEGLFNRDSLNYLAQRQDRPTIDCTDR